MPTGYIGSALTPAADVHAGQRRRRGGSRPCRSACDRRRCGTSTAADRSAPPADCAARSPGETRISCAKLRVISPAPTSSISASATSTTTSALSRRPPERRGRAGERVHRVAQAGARRLDRGHEPEDQRDADRDHQREQQHAAVETHVLHARQAAFGQRVHEAHAGPRDEQAERAADRRQHEALGEHLAHQLPSVRRRAPRARRSRCAGSRAAPASGSRRWRRRSAAGIRPRAEISSSAGRTVVTSCSCAEITRAPQPVLLSGNVVASRPAMTVISRCACSCATPSASRPTTFSDRALRERPCASFGSKLSGVQMSTCALGGKSNSRRHHADDGVGLRVELNRPADRRPAIRRNAAPRTRG